MAVLIYFLVLQHKPKNKKNMKNQISARQAIKFAKQSYKEKFGKNAYNAHIHVMKRYGGGNTVLIICGDNTIEYYF